MKIHQYRILLCIALSLTVQTAHATKTGIQLQTLGSVEVAVEPDLEMGYGELSATVVPEEMELSTADLKRFLDVSVRALIQRDQPERLAGWPQDPDAALQEFFQDAPGTLLTPELLARRLTVVSFFLNGPSRRAQRTDGMPTPFLILSTSPTTSVERTPADLQFTPDATTTALLTHATESMRKIELLNDPERNTFQAGFNSMRRYFYDSNVRKWVAFHVGFTSVVAVGWAVSYSVCQDVAPCVEGYNYNGLTNQCELSAGSYGAWGPTYTPGGSIPNSTRTLPPHGIQDLNAACFQTRHTILLDTTLAQLGVHSVPLATAVINGLFSECGSRARRWFEQRYLQKTLSALHTLTSSTADRDDAVHLLSPPNWLEHGLNRCN